MSEKVSFTPGPKKPNQIVMDLFALGHIRGVIVDYRQTGTDTADTFCEILGDGKKKVSGLWRTYSPFLDVRVSWSSIAEVKSNYRKDYDDWLKFEKENAKELAEYNRLKAKFEGAE